MDRDQRWERVKKTYDVIVYGEGKSYPDPQTALAASYANDIFDEFVEPVVILDEDGDPVGRFEDEVSFIFYNFLPIQTNQLSEVFIGSSFAAFDLGLTAP